MDLMTNVKVVWHSGEKQGVTEQWNNIQANNFIVINAENNSTIIINA